jgi:hypothetical protein
LPSSLPMSVPFPNAAPPQSAAIAAFNVALGRIAAETLAGSGR